MSPFRSLVALLAVSITACSPGQKDPAVATDDAELVASYDGGVLTKADLEAAILDVPPELRPADGSARAAWLEEFIAELVVDRLLGVSAAADTPANDPEIAATCAELERNLAWEELLRSRLDAVEPPTEEEVAAAARLEVESRPPEMRLVRNIFLRPEEGESSGDLESRARELAARVAGGASFVELAAGHSDSETRHRGGLIGWVTAERLPTPVRDVVFSLQEREASTPLVNRDGAHLFYVDAIRFQAAQNADEIASAVREKLEAQERERAITALVDRLPEPEGLFVLGRAELEAAIAGENESTVVLSRNDYELTLAELASDSEALEATLQSRLEQLAWRERAQSLAESEGWFEVPHLERQLAIATRARVGELLRRRHLREYLLDDEERLETFYEAERARFSTKLELKLRRWSLAASPSERKRIVLALEDLHRDVGAAALDLKAIQIRHGGTIEDLGWRKLSELPDRGIAAMLAPIAAGETSPPIVRGSEVVALRLVERRDPQPQTFAQARQAVVDLLLTDRGQSIYREWRSHLLAANGAKLIPDSRTMSGDGDLHATD